MLIERTHNGMWCISEIVKGVLVTRRYMDYSKREAIQLFKQEVREELDHAKTKNHPGLSI